MEKSYIEGVIPQYRFYFALENSDCKDYITEKSIRAMGV